MPRNALEFRVVIASPSDVYTSRQVVTEVIHELNRALELQNVVITGLGWEENASPGIGTEAQDVVSQQILREYDILLAIFGRTIGTPSKTSPSGTIEEIEHAISSENRDMGIYRVQVYFLDRFEGLSSHSVSELQKVAEFRDTLSKRGVFYRTFHDENELQREVRNNLHRAVSEYLLKNGPAPPANIPPTLPTEASETDHASALAIPSAQDDLGLLDYSELAESALESVTNAVNAMAALIAEIGNETERQVVEIEKVSSPSVPASQKKIVINAFADYLKTKATKLKQEAITARTGIIGYSEAMGTLLELLHESGRTQEYEQSFSQYLAVAETMLQSVTTGREGVVGFAQTVEGLPRITIQFNQAKRVLLDALKDCLSAIDATEKTIFSITSRG